MLHARKDYDRIQDPDGIIPEDEPVFLIRGQDILAHDQAEARGADPEIVATVRKHAHAIACWPKKKIPDMPDGAGR